MAEKWKKRENEEEIRRIIKRINRKRKDRGIVEESQNGYLL